MTNESLPGPNHAIEFSVELSTTEIDQILSNREHPLRLELINLLLQGSSRNISSRRRLWQADPNNVFVDGVDTAFRGRKKHRGKHRSHIKGANAMHTMHANIKRHR